MIKYKGKSLDSCEWVEGSLLKDGDRYYIGAYVNKILYSSKVAVYGRRNGKTHSKWNIFGLVEVIPESVGQYTGENDNKNTEIYVGDMFRDPLSPNSIGIVKFGRYTNCFDKSEIKFGGHVGFYVDFKEKYIRSDLQYWSNHTSIIGNIIDNPELLEGQEV